MPRLPAHVLVETNCRGHSVTAVTGPRGILCLDTPLLPTEAEAWKRRLLEKSRTISFIIQMDASPDRAFSAAHLASVFEGQPPTLLTHQQTTDAMKTLQDSFKNSPLLGALEATSYGLDPLSLRWPRPAMAFNGSMTIHWNPATVILHHAPSTTPGACWVHLPEEKILFIGDAVSVSLPPLLHEGRFDAWLETLTALRRGPYKDSRLFCSHGGWIDAEAVSKFVNFLRSAQRKAAAIREKSDPQKDIALASQSLLEFFTFPAERRDFLLRRLQIGLRALWEREHVPVPAERAGSV
jgi:glyoxylase-like metal-dependent hydrolase (beta-lactamase superfamily II)